MNKLEQIRQKFQSKTLEERQQYLALLSPKELRVLYSNPDLFLFDKQIITGDQRYTILRCGRSFGKSFTGAAWVAKKVMNGAKIIGLVGPTHKDVVDVMVAAIIKWFPKGEAWYVSGEKHKIYFKNYNAVVYCYSSDTEIRGPNLEYLWCDEICKWCDSIPDKVKECFDLVDLAVRVGKNPQIVITSTPKDFPIFRDWQKKVDEGNPRYKMYTGTMFDNPFLSDSFKQSMIEKFGGTRLGRQELYGELLLDVEGAAWNQKMIDDCRISYDDFKSKLSEKITKVSERGVYTSYNKFEISRIVVGVDPTVSDKPDGDECGIIIAALGSDGHVYVLNDYSGQYTTDQWAKKSIQALNDYEAGMIVIEKNNGGELVKKNIQSFDSAAPVKTVQAIKGKIDRALPVAALYERSLVHHVQPKRTKEQIESNYNVFEKLEHQMTHYTGNPKLKSPDRLDALVWAIFELKLSNTYVNRDYSAIGSF